jgi:pilus assembly protein CpaD
MRAVLPLAIRGGFAIAVAACLAGCVHRPDPSVTGSIPDSYEVRHPIQVTQGLQTLDLLPGGGPGGMTDRQVADLREFASEWRKQARGPITVEIPRGGSTDAQSARVVRDIRAVFVGAGVPARAVVETRYPANGPGHLAPVRLAFPLLKAEVPHECGQWPEDVGYGGPGTSNENRQDWNYGCAYQQNIAAMIEDPEDLIRPRAEDPADATRRSDVVRKYRRGEATQSSSTPEAISTN